MSFRSRWIPLLAAVAMLLGAFSCSGPSEPLLGVVLPFTGEAAPYGEHIRQGINLALEEVNAAGGIQGQPLRLIFEDSGSDPEKGMAAARKLIEQDHVPALIGGATSSVTRAVLDEVSAPAKVVLLSPAASSPNLSGASSYFLRVYPSDTLEGARMADLAADELRLKRLVLFSVADEYGRGYKRAFIDRYSRNKNREIIKVHNFMPTDRDFTAMVAETAELAPDGIFLIGYMDAVSKLAQDIRAAGITAPILASGSLTEDFPRMAGEAAEGVMFARPSFRAIGNPEKAAAFIAAFKAKYGREPEDYAAYGYDALKIMAQVMGQGNLDAASILLAIRSPESAYDGVTGRIVFGNEGDVVASPTTFIVSQGAVVPYKEYLEAGGAPPAPPAGDESTEDSNGNGD